LVIVGSFQLAVFDTRRNSSGLGPRRGVQLERIAKQYCPMLQSFPNQIRDFCPSRGAGNPARSRLSGGFLPVANCEEPPESRLQPRLPAPQCAARKLSAVSFQLSAIGFQLTGVRLSDRLGGLSGRIVAARKDSQV
jgi:hypothetical protein